MSSLEDDLKREARHIGFALVGIAPAEPADGFARLQAWLERGFDGEMTYLRRRRESRRHPASILPDVRSVVMVGMSHAVAAPTPGARIARYAQGDDYHDVLRGRLRQLLAWIRQRLPNARGRAVVDTAPLLERDFARRAGLGWFGKNTMLLNKRSGSWFLLGALLLDVELCADSPHTTSHCGTCTACLDACPTGAFDGPGWLDARKCISYLTIELRGDIPSPLRAGVGDWLFGCDVCQEVCPWNRRTRSGDEPRLQPRLDIDPVEVLELSEEEFRNRFAGTALERPGREGLARNAAIVLGNRRERSALAALQRAADSDPSPIVREAASWAIARMHESRDEPAAP
jgi:epoxyqueuosine reductase